MNQKEFIELSKKEVRELNAGYNSVDDHAESWRGGYEFAREKILKLLQEKYAEDFLTEVEEFATQELDVFDSYELINPSNK